MNDIDKSMLNGYIIYNFVTDERTRAHTSSFGLLQHRCQKSTYPFKNVYQNKNILHTQNTRRNNKVGSMRHNN